MHQGMNEWLNLPRAVGIDWVYVPLCPSPIPFHTHHTQGFIASPAPGQPHSVDYKAKDVKVIK